MAPLSARTAVEELLKALPAGQPLDARIVLAAHPELNGHRSEILDLIYEEYCRRVEAGESIAPAEFAARFPSLSRSLLRLFDVHRLLVEGKKLFQPDFDLDWPKPGELWLNFQLLEEIGRGAFSRVYVAREALLGNRLAVVKATPLGPREAEMLGKLGHLHVVPVFSVQRDEELDLSAVCMPFLSRATLLDVMDAVFSGKPPTRAAAILDVVRQINSPTSRIEPVVEEECHWSRRWSYVEGVLHIGIQIAEALNHAHRLGILHCDVKPSNVLLTNHGRAILLDFNLSRLQGGGTPFCGGTLPYMSPEQLSVLLPEERSQPGEAGVPSDVFSFGVTLFEILCGRNPFGALRSSSTRLDAARELLQRQRRGLCPYDIESAGIDRRVAAIIGRCLDSYQARRQANRRYQDSGKKDQC